MRLTKEVSHFSASCEHLMAEAESNARKLTDEETLLIEYYCREVLKKVVKRPAPPQQQQQDSSGSPRHSNLPQSDPKKQAISRSV